VTKFVLVHCGFEQPTTEIMAAWGKWFESIKDRTVDNLGFAGGREISRAGTMELAWGPESVTGISIVNAASLDEAENMAKSCPFISSIKVYEVRSH
jgi:hypothetical protein